MADTASALPAGPFDEIIGAMRELREKYDDAVEVLSMIADGEFTDPRQAAETLLRNHGFRLAP